MISSLVAGARALITLMLVALQAQPRIMALWGHVSGRHDIEWDKTPRTAEEGPGRECRTAPTSMPEPAMDERHA